MTTLIRNLFSLNAISSAQRASSYTLVLGKITISKGNKMVFCLRSYLSELFVDMFNFTDLCLQAKLVFFTVVAWCCNHHASAAQAKDIAKMDCHQTWQPILSQYFLFSSKSKLLQPGWGQDKHGYLRLNQANKLFSMIQKWGTQQLICSVFLRSIIF